MRLFYRFRLPGRWVVAGLVVLLAGLGKSICAQEKPYFVTYATDLEEPGNLEIASLNLAAGPKGGNGFLSSTMELEYGTKAWWTTEVYLQGQTTANDSTVFNGFRVENRFKPLPREYWLTPVIYVEYENVNEADKSILEVTGNDGISDFRSPNSEGRATTVHTIEGKLILSSNPHGWNISENVIAEKNLSNHPWEFGYALGVARPLALAGSVRECWLCRNNMDAGLEMYGGLGTHASFGLHETSHYAGPVVDYRVPHGPTVSFTPQFGLSENSIGTLWRFKVSWEVQQVRDIFKKENE